MVNTLSIVKGLSRDQYNKLFLQMKSFPNFQALDIGR